MFVCFWSCEIKRPILAGSKAYEATEVCAPRPDEPGAFICYLPKSMSIGDYVFVGKEWLAKKQETLQLCEEALSLPDK